jgi:hypothetical protein
LVHNVKLKSLYLSLPIQVEFDTLLYNSTSLNVDVASLRNNFVRALIRDACLYDWRWVLRQISQYITIYHNLQIGGTNVAYGATEMVDSCTFVKYLGELG